MIGNTGHIQLTELCLLQHLFIYHIPSIRSCENFRLLNKIFYQLHHGNILISCRLHKKAFSNGTEFVVEYCQNRFTKKTKWLIPTEIRFQCLTCLIIFDTHSSTQKKCLGTFRRDEL